MFRITRRRCRAVEGNADPVVPQAAARSGLPGRHRVRRWPLAVIASPAMVAIWSGWVSLGEMCGFGMVEPFPGITKWRLDTAMSLPIGVEAYGAFAMSAWLSPTTPENARRFAKWSALGSLALGMLGQVAYHLLSAAHQTRAPWPVVVVVACLPVITLGFGAALLHLLGGADTAAADEETTQETPLSQDGPDEEKEDERPPLKAAPALSGDLVEQARTLDAEHRLANHGKPISRDNLKLGLGIATDKATALVHLVRAEHDPPTATDPVDQQADTDLPHAA
jgi:hypothetical protein